MSLILNRATTGEQTCSFAISRKRVGGSSRTRSNGAIVGTKRFRTIPCWRNLGRPPSIGTHCPRPRPARTDFSPHASRIDRQATPRLTKSMLDVAKDVETAFREHHYLYLSASPRHQRCQ